MLQNLDIIPSSGSRLELLTWVNETMPHTAPNGANIPTVRRVESCGSFVPYLLMLPNMLPVAYPPLSSATRVKVPARHEFEAIANLKLLQDALHRNGVPKPDVLADSWEKILHGNFQANMTFLQWFKGFHDALQEAGIEPAPPRNAGLGESAEAPTFDRLDSSMAGLGPGVRMSSRRSSVQRRGSVSSQREDSRGGSLRRSSRPMTSAELPPRRGTPTAASATGAAPRATRTGGTPRASAARPPAAGAAKARAGTPPVRSTASRTASGRLGATTGSGYGVRATSPTVGSRGLAASSNGISHSSTTGSAARAGRASTPTGTPGRARASSTGLSSSTGSRVARSAAAAGPVVNRPVASDDSVQQVKLERQFYFDKLRMIEKLVASLATRDLTGDDVAAVSLARSVRDVLYATN